jgi:DNA-binding Lrp family transcriptional regulator
VFGTSGSEDFLVHVAVPDDESLYALVIDRLTERPVIADVRTSVVDEHLRERRVDPAVSAGPAPRASTPRRPPAR